MQLSRVFAPFTALAARVRSPRTRSFEVDLAELTQPSEAERAMMGLWVADDGAIRLSLRPNGRYDKRLAAGENTYRGRYEVDGSRLYFESDSGKTWVGENRRDSLVLGDHRFVRPQAHRSRA